MHDRRALLWRNMRPALAPSSTCGNCLRALPHRRRLLKAALGWEGGGEGVVSGRAQSRTQQRPHWASEHLKLTHMRSTHLLEAAEACKALLPVACCICVSLCNCREPLGWWHASYAFEISRKASEETRMADWRAESGVRRAGALLCCLRAAAGNLTRDLGSTVR